VIGPIILDRLILHTAISIFNANEVSIELNGVWGILSTTKMLRSAYSLLISLMTVTEHRRLPQRRRLLLSNRFLHVLQLRSLLVITSKIIQMINSPFESETTRVVLLLSKSNMAQFPPINIANPFFALKFS